MTPAASYRDLNVAAVCAGVTAFLWYAFGAVPLLVAVARQLGLTEAQASSWLFIVWFGGAVSSIALSLYYRQPIPIASTIPGLVYLGTLAGQFTFPELVGANLMAALVILGLGLLGLGGRIMTWFPLPIIMGMFAGNILGYVTGLVKATVEDILVAGPTVAGYLLGRSLGKRVVPPLGLAAVCGAIASLWVRQTSVTPLSWGLPQLAVPGMSFSIHAFLAVTLPMVVLSMGLGNIQGLGFLVAEGYRVPADPVTIVVGVNSIVNALLGGHPAIVARNGVAIVAGHDAGPLSGRYWANVIAAVPTMILALAASPVTSLLSTLPRAYLVALTGLAILSSFQDALARAFTGTLRFGALVAFGVAATPFAFGGIPSAFWSILAGLAVSLVVEWDDLLAHLGEQGALVPTRADGEYRLRVAKE